MINVSILPRKPRPGSTKSWGLHCREQKKVMTQSLRDFVNEGKARENTRIWQD